MDCECLCWFSRLQGPNGKPGLPGMPGADGPPVSLGNIHASHLLISGSIVRVSERFHCINNYSTVICLAILSSLTHIVQIRSQSFFYPHGKYSVAL